MTATETEQLVRKALKAEFPGREFNVRCETHFSGGTIAIRWLESPPGGYGPRRPVGECLG